MTNTAISRHGLERRRSQLSDLRRYLQAQEQAFEQLRDQVQGFVGRYVTALGESYLELDALESQLHSTTNGLAEALRRSGVAARSPRPPQATALPVLPQLPVGAALPPEPTGGQVEMAAPTLKTLYRRAAMRLHPDFAGSEADRRSREQNMMLVNEAYAASNRAQLELLLLAAGEDPVRVSGSNCDALRLWLGRCEELVQGRLRVVQAHTALLNHHPMHGLWLAIERAEQLGLDPLSVMANRLRSQIAERRQELYIGQRLQPLSGLAQAFLHRRIERMGAAASAS